MAIRIKREEFEHLMPSQPGKIRVNHNSESCRGDSASLLIDRSKYGCSCYCFRCGGRGFFSFDRRFVPIADRREESPTRVHDANSGLDLPGDLAPLMECDGGRAAREWLGKAGILSPVIIREGFRWSEAEQALYIPVHRYIMALGPVLAGYVKRGFDPKSYRTLRSAQDGMWGLYRGEGAMGVQGQGVCLVESVVDALRVAQAGMDALALCGTELAPAAASYILTEGYSHAIIFLDGDNPTVKMKARQIANKLSWLPTRIIETGQDPKHLPEQKLNEMLFQV